MLIFLSHCIKVENQNNEWKARWPLKMADYKMASAQDGGIQNGVSILTGEDGAAFELLVDLATGLPVLREGRLVHEATQVVVAFEVRLAFLGFAGVKIRRHVCDLDVRFPGVKVMRVHLWEITSRKAQAECRNNSVQTFSRNSQQIAILMALRCWFRAETSCTHLVRAHFWPRG